MYVISGSTNTTPSDIISLNSPNMPSPSTHSNSPRNTPTIPEVKGGGTPGVTPPQQPQLPPGNPLPGAASAANGVTNPNTGSVNECRWIDQNTLQVGTVIHVVCYVYCLIYIVYPRIYVPCSHNKKCVCRVWVTK